MKIFNFRKNFFAFYNFFGSIKNIKLITKNIKYLIIEKNMYKNKLLNYLYIRKCLYIFKTIKNNVNIIISIILLLINKQLTIKLINLILNS